MAEVRAKKKFLDLIKKEILQLDLADLDFGLYRLLKYRRDRILRFLEEDLPRKMEEALKTGYAERLKARQKELADLEAQLQNAAQGLDLPAALQDGVPVPGLQHTPAAQRYLALKRELEAEARFTEDEENHLYNHLYVFFSRYYRDGDFLPLYRRAREARYSVPYSGEDVHFHWATRGSHYVKTGESFTRYRYADSPWTVEFELVEAQTEKDNVKGKKRYFVPLEVQEGPGTRKTVKMGYLPEDDERMKPYLKAEGRSGNRVQEALLEAWVEAHKQALIPLNLESLKRHLYRYARKNTTDYFVHPRLGEFLRSELDYYLKNEFLNLDTFTSPERMEDRFVKMRVLREIGRTLIAFLEQLETFQACLFEKRRFVLESGYLVSLRLVPERFYPEILANKKQLEKWKELFKLEIRDEADLKAHPTLVLDTRHFPPSFTRLLLEVLTEENGLDEITDGVLVYSENYGALRTLLPRFREQVKVIYIDPPFNTGQDGFLYKDRYQHSSWLSFMVERIKISFEFLKNNGAFFIHVDDNESHLIKKVLDLTLPPGAYQNEIIWAYGGSARGAKAIAGRLPRNHDTIFLFAKDPVNFKLNKVFVPFRVHKSIAKEYGYKQDEQGRWFKTAPKGDYTDESIAELRKQGRVYETSGGNIRIKYFLREEGRYVVEDKLVGDVWSDIPDMMHAPKSERIGFDTQKPLRLIERIIQLGGDNNSYVLDFFAGSGTTGHAVINLNREDGGRRRFILVEMADYFETVLVPRIKKVMYAPEWRDGVPKEEPRFDLGVLPEWVERSPRLIQVLKLESYEDSLDALELPETLKPHQQGRLEYYGDDYLIRYMLPNETEESEVFLNLEKLYTPFDYSLCIHTPEGVQEKKVDLPTTFNLVMGLQVGRVRWLQGLGRDYLIYEALEEGRPVLVVWREVDPNFNDLDPAEERCFLDEKVRALLGRALTDYEKVYHNAEAALPKGVSLDAPFKARLLERDPNFA